LVVGRCLSCDTRLLSRLVHRELFLLIILAGVTVAAFFATRAVAHGNEALRRRQGAAWFDQALRASRNGNAETAIAGLRRAVSKDSQNRQYRLALADSLSANRLDEEAKRVLLALRDSRPEDPDANLQLARLEARGPDADAARRYYQNSLAGLWRSEQADERRRVRIELIEFLLARGERERALAELLVLTANLPQDAAVQTRAGRMFLAAGDPRLALDRFTIAVRLDSERTAALAGAGEAAFELGDYSRALRYLNAAPGEGARVAELREVASLVLNGDPLAPRLGANERRSRLLVFFQHAVRRLETCLSDPSVRTSTSLEQLRTEARDFQSALGQSRRPARDLVDDGVDLVYRLERTVEQSCGAPPAPHDRALLLIGRRHGFEEQ
jgi:tetratricopeptide (TPR) repeat protein